MKIVADSCCEYTEKFMDDGVKVEFVPLSLQIGDNNYVDDESLDLNEYMQTMENSKHALKTAAPSPHLFWEKFKSTSSVFVVTLSSKLSATFNNAVLARNMIEEDDENKSNQGSIHIFDSLSASIGETLTVLKIKELIAKKIPDLEIVDNVNKYISDMKTFFVLDSYDNLVKGGRIEPYVAKIAQLLSIKPICAGINGKMVVAKKVRGAKMVIPKLAEMIASEKLDFENRILGISHVKCLDKAIALKNEISKRVKFKDCIIADTGGLSSTYADKNGMIIAY